MNDTSAPTSTHRARALDALAATRTRRGTHNVPAHPQDVADAVWGTQANHNGDDATRALVTELVESLCTPDEEDRYPEWMEQYV